MIWVRSRKFIEEIWEPVLPTAVISITTPGDPPASIPESELVPVILRLQFHDVGPGDHELSPMSEEQAEQVVEFIMNIPPVACVLIHCDARISRSAGVAGAISKVLFGDDSFFFINYLPNRHCHRLVLEAFYNASAGMSDMQ